MRNKLYELHVKVNERRPVREYDHTDGYTYIEGRKGSEYIIEIANNSLERVMAVISVDGLSVLNGTTNWDDGYIVDAQSTIQIPGWTIDKTKIAKFEFDDPYKSYTSRIGNGSSNVGVIGAMIFKEKIHQVNAYRSMFPKSISTQGGIWSGSLGITSQTAAISTLEMGTGWGEESNFNISEVQFERRDPTTPDATLALYYDSAKGLEKRGIVMDFSKYNPNPFPGLENSIGCKRPR